MHPHWLTPNLPPKNNPSMLTANLSIVSLRYATTENTNHFYSFSGMSAFAVWKKHSAGNENLFLSEIYEVLKAVIPQQNAITFPFCFCSKAASVHTWDEGLCPWIRTWSLNSTTSLCLLVTSSFLVSLDWLCRTRYQWYFLLTSSVFTTSFVGYLFSTYI